MASHLLTPTSPVTDREFLAMAHHDICTALTVMYTNVALIRTRLAEGEAAESMRVLVERLDALDRATDRLRAVAHDFRRRHAAG